MNNKTLLCFDYGEKRIGVAVGQTITSTATALETIIVRNKKPDWDAIGKLISEWKPDKFVVGHPFTLEGARQKLDPTSAKLILETWFRENTGHKCRQNDSNKEN